MRLSFEQARLWSIFCLGLFWFVSVRVIGDLFASEVILLTALPFLLVKHGKELRNPLVKRVMLFGHLWLVSQMVTDLVRGTEIVSLAKGWLSIIFFLGGFCAMYLLVRGNEKRLNALIVGFAFGSILKGFVDPGYGFDVEPWKFGFGFPTMILAIIVVSRGDSKKVISDQIGLVLLLLLGGLSIYLNARSLGGVLILTTLLIGLSKSRLVRQVLLERLNPARKTGLITLVTGMILSVLVTYQWVGEEKLLPENAQFKYEMVKSSSLGVFGIILAGRSELLASVPAVIDSPIIGHGSWAEDRKYRAYLYKINAVLGLDRDEDQLRRMVEENDRIPAHSHLMQSWVWAGFLGALFWLLILKLIGHVAVISLRYRSHLSMLALFICIKAAWDLLFSPFSSFMRFQWDWELILMLMILEENSRPIRRNEGMNESAS